MLRIAVPNKGSLSETASDMLAEAGYSRRRDTTRPRHRDPENDVEFFYLRPRDIATYVGSGALDVGITGRDLLLDAQVGRRRAAAARLRRLDLPLRRPRGRTSRSVADLEGMRVATSYPGLVREFLAELRHQAKLVRLDGAVESAVRLGVADAIADVVETGTTLKAAGLEIFGPPILQSEAAADRAPRRHARRRRRGPAPPPAQRAGRAPVRAARLRRAAKLMEQATALTPGLESPTVSPLRDPDWVAVRVHGPAQGHQPDHGRAVRARRPRHPGQQHPRLPHLESGDAMSVAIRVIPCLDVAGGRVVKGVNFENLRDAGRPRRTGQALLPAGRRRTHVPRRHGVRRQPGDDLRRGRAARPNRSSSR